MKQSFIQLYLKEKKSYALVVGVLLLIIFLLVGYVYEQHKDVRDAQALSNTLKAESSTVPGAACSILSLDRAEELLDSSVYRLMSNVRVPTDDGVKLQTRHLDSCRYVARGNSNLYVELYITTYDDPKIAEMQYERKLPAVSNIELLDASKYSGKILSYDGGVHYLLRGKQIIEVAASNGSTTRQKQFSRELLDEFMIKIQPL